MTLNLAHLRDWIGREEVVEERLDPLVVARFAATVGLSDTAWIEGATAPRLIHFCLCQPAVPMAALGPDGHPARGGFLPPVPLPRRMWAASGIVFPGDLVIGRTTVRRSRVADVEVKTGRTGTLCFVTVDHRIEQDGATAVEDRQTLVYREAASPARARATDPAPRGAATEIVDPSPTLLFRYSALTFNGHRIHYDRPYATEVEGYAGLVVHGPLQATLLLGLAGRVRGREPDAFRFRGVSPLTDDAAIELHAGEAVGDTMPLWSARVGGAVGLTAEAAWS